MLTTYFHDDEFEKMQWKLQRSTLNIPPSDWTYTDFVKDIDALASHVGAVDIGVLGTSTGGMNCLAASALMHDRHLAVVKHGLSGKVRVSGALLISCDASYQPGYPRLCL